MISRRRRLWTEVEVAELRRLLAAGQRPKQIAQQLGRSVRAIELKLAVSDRPRKPEALVLNGDDKSLIRAAAFDRVGWVLPDMPPEIADKLNRAHLIERRNGRWYLRSRAFKVRAEMCRSPMQCNQHP